MFQGDIKKRLLKAMPHIPLLELRPELREQNETRNDPDDPQTQQDATDPNSQSVDGADAAEMEGNTTFHDFEAEHTGGNNGLVQRVKRFISKRKVKGGKNAVGRIGLVGAEDDDMRYGDDESSESDNEGDQHDGIPLVGRNKRT